MICHFAVVVGNSPQISTYFKYHDPYLQLMSPPKSHTVDLRGTVILTCSSFFFSFSSLTKRFRFPDSWLNVTAIKVRQTSHRYVEGC